MSENVVDSNAVPVGDDWFDQWMSTGTVAQRSLDVYGRPDLYGRFEELERRLEHAKQAKGDLSLGDSGADSILEEMTELHKQWTASKSVWFIRALSSDEIDAINETVKHPTDPGEDATGAAKRKFEAADKKADDQVNASAIAKALVRVENAEGVTVKDSITPEQVLVLKDKLGERQMARLMAAAMVAMAEDVEIPSPFSLRSSESDLDS